ncbi:MAG: VWA domain-containing protein [Legionellales bacterium]
MTASFHFLRPWCFLALVPLLGLILLLWRQQPRLHAWANICDSHLLAHLIQRKGQGKRMFSLFFLFLSAFFMVISGAGPTWVKLPVATYKFIQPRVLVLDMSEHMLLQDLSPNRLSRAKFIIHDLLMRTDVGQFGLVVFTGEPFVVSPLTDDGHTIASLLSTLTPDIMPVDGQNLESALAEASQLIKAAGYAQGQILVLTADSPSVAAIALAKKLAHGGVFSSIMPMTAETNLHPLFQRFADSGAGQLLLYPSAANDLQQWLNQGTRDETFALSKDDDIPLWRDEGRWFLWPALLLLLPVFRRGWLQRVAV